MSEPGGSSERLLRKAETVLAHRTDRILLVLERCTDNQNYLACLRTAEILGIQNVWIVLSPRGGGSGKQKGGGAADAAGADDGAGAEEGGGAVPGTVDKGEVSRKRGRIARCSSQWLDTRTFATTGECVAALKEDGREVWATDLDPSAEPLAAPGTPGAALPGSLAIVMGREADGVSQEMLAAAHKRVYLPMFGFNDSFNLSVATAMVLHHLLLCCPEARGDLSTQRREALRADWYGKLARNDSQRSEFLSRLADPPTPFPEERLARANGGSYANPKVAKREGAQQQGADRAVAAAQREDGDQEQAGEGEEAG